MLEASIRLKGTDGQWHHVLSYVYIEQTGYVNDDDTTNYIVVSLSPKTDHTNETVLSTILVGIKPPEKYNLISDWLDYLFGRAVEVLSYPHPAMPSTYNKQKEHMETFIRDSIRINDLRRAGT